MRISRRALRTKVKSSLPVQFTTEKLTSYGGLEVIRQFMHGSGLLQRLKEAFSIREFDTDYGSYRMALSLIAMWIIGGSRLRPLQFLAHDPIVLRFAQRVRLPEIRTMSRWLGSITEGVRERIVELMRERAYDSARLAKVARVTLELDGTVLRTGLCAEGAERGFNPHPPKDKSYYPLTAHRAQTGQLLDIQNRPGNVHDSRGAADMLRTLVDDIRKNRGQIPIEVRLDGAFFQAPILRLLAESGVGYALKVPMWRGLDLRGPIANRKRWTPIRPRLSAFSMTLRIPKWDIKQKVVVYRKHVSGKTRKNFQLDLFSPDDGHSEYSVVATNKSLSLVALWDFMAGRGGHEKTLGELKTHLAFDTIPCQDWDAHCMGQLMVGLTHNLIRHFQLRTIATRRPRGRKRTTLFVMETLRTLRFEWIHVPARLARPQGRDELRIAASPDARFRYEAILAALDRAA